MNRKSDGSPLVLRRGWIGLWLLLSPALLFARDPGLTPALTIDWPDSRLELEVLVDLGTDATAPDARFRAESRVREDLEALLQEVLENVPAESDRTVGEMLSERREALPRLAELAGRMVLEASAVSREEANARVIYSLPLYPHFPDLLLERTEPDPLPRPVGYVSPTEYTGLIIYAKGDVPRQGTNRTGQYEPILFPRIMDENGRVLAGPETVETEFLRERGVCAFLPDFPRIFGFGSRTGGKPLRVMARELAGDTPGDIVIASDDAAKLTANPANRRILREGRIIVLYDLPSRN